VNGYFDVKKLYNFVSLTKNPGSAPAGLYYLHEPIIPQTKLYSSFSQICSQKQQIQELQFFPKPKVNLGFEVGYIENKATLKVFVIVARRP